ncbi:MAG: YdaU family protein [Betaproteobacteria bacterium]
MSFQYMPLYTGDYLRDTQHLSCSEHGIYLKFMMHCWDQKGPVPLDERKQCGICNARSGDEVEAMRRVLQEFFTRMDDGYYNKRMAEEIAKAEGLSLSRSNSGKLGAVNSARSKARSASSASAEQLLNKSLASAEQELGKSRKTIDHNPILDHTPNPSTNTDIVNNTGCLVAAEKTTPQPKAEKLSKRTRYAREDEIPDSWREFAVQECDGTKAMIDADRVYERFCDYWAGNGEVKSNWFATWRNWVRREIDQMPNKRPVLATQQRDVWDDPNIL